MELPCERIGPYRLTRWLGSGGIVHVFAAVKVLDFGIAKVPASPNPDQVNTRVQTGAPTFLGTATYMAPEQCRNVAEATPKADVYSLGVILFELLSGRPPFESSEPVDLMAMHLQVPPPHLAGLSK